MVGWTVPFTFVLMPMLIVGVSGYLGQLGVRAFRPEGSRGAAWFPTVDAEGNMRRQHIVPQVLDNDKLSTVEMDPLVATPT